MLEMASLIASIGSLVSGVSAGRCGVEVTRLPMRSCLPMHLGIYAVIASQQAERRHTQGDRLEG